MSNIILVSQLASLRSETLVNYFHTRPISAKKQLTPHITRSPFDARHCVYVTSRIMSNCWTAPRDSILSVWGDLPRSAAQPWAPSPPKPWAGSACRRGSPACRRCNPGMPSRAPTRRAPWRSSAWRSRTAGDVCRVGRADWRGRRLPCHGERRPARHGRGGAADCAHLPGVRL